MKAHETKRPPKRTALLALATFLAAFLLYRSLETPPIPQAEPEKPPITQTTVPSPELPAPEATSLAAKNPENTSSQNPEGAIPDEAILVFDSDAAFQNFINTAHPNLTLLAQNPTLRSLRIRSDNLNELDANGAQIDFNYTLLTPLPIVGASGPLGPSFEDTALEFMRAPVNNQQSGQGVTIAILDSGIQRHTTLEDIQIKRFDLNPTSDSLELNSHGTAVASLISGKNGNGIAPAANLISIRVLDTEGIGDTFSLADGIVKAVDEGANIINMSLGSYGSNLALANAVEYAHSKGVVLVASAGNESVSTLPYPAAYDSVIAVGAIDANGHPGGFSNQSDAVDIAAPGVGVFAAWAEEDWIRFTGTSAAAPYVAGAIATISSELDIPASDAASLLLENANDTGLPGPDRQTGQGYVDVQRSLDSNTSYADIALADIYLEETPNSYGLRTVHITAQNRGTTPLPLSYIDYTLPNNVTQTIYLGPLEPGASASHSFTVQSLELEKQEGLKITAAARPPPETSEPYSQNNTRTLTLKLQTPEE